MTTREEAAEQLRIIRSVMERATVFRSLSGETALIGGAAALAAAWLTDGRHGWLWASWWLVGFVVVMGFNVFQIIRMKQADNRPFWSPGLRVALRGALPSLLAGGFLGLLFVRSGNYRSDVRAEELGASVWILHYGLALLAIREFTPKSMVWLGWAFVIFGGLSLAGVAGLSTILESWISHANASRLMALAFGGFHLIYGALIVTTGRREA